jgi:hypothetical protein
LEYKGKFDLGVDQQVVCKISIAGNVKLEWGTLNQMAVHDDPDPAVVAGRDHAHEHEPWSSGGFHEVA